MKNTYDGHQKTVIKASDKSEIIDILTQHQQQKVKLAHKYDWKHCRFKSGAQEEEKKKTLGEKRRENKEMSGSTMVKKRNADRIKYVILSFIREM